MNKKTATRVTDQSERQFHYSRWRHGGWYVNIYYPSGACGCVSRNFVDGKWRIVVETGRHAPGSPGDRTFPTRAAAAQAEYDLVNAEHGRLPEYVKEIADAQLKYSAVALIRALDDKPDKPLAEQVESTLRIRTVEAEALRSIGERYLDQREQQAA